MVLVDSRSVGTETGKQADACTETGVDGHVDVDVDVQIVVAGLAAATAGVEASAVMAMASIVWVGLLDLTSVPKERWEEVTWCSCLAGSRYDS